MKLTQKEFDAIVERIIEPYMEREETYKQNLQLLSQRDPFCWMPISQAPPPVGMELLVFTRENQQVFGTLNQNGMWTLCGCGRETWTSEGQEIVGWRLKPNAPIFIQQ